MDKLDIAKVLTFCMQETKLGGPLWICKITSYDKLVWLQNFPRKLKTWPVLIRYSDPYKRQMAIEMDHFGTSATVQVGSVGEKYS